MSATFTSDCAVRETLSRSYTHGYYYFGFVSIALHRRHRLRGRVAIQPVLMKYDANPRKGKRERERQSRSLKSRCRAHVCAEKRGNLIVIVKNPRKPRLVISLGANSRKQIRQIGAARERGRMSSRKKRSDLRTALPRRFRPAGIRR